MYKLSFILFFITNYLFIKSYSNSYSYSEQPKSINIQFHNYNKSSNRTDPILTSGSFIPKKNAKAVYSLAGRWINAGFNISSIFCHSGSNIYSLDCGKNSQNLYIVFNGVYQNPVEIKYHLGLVNLFDIFIKSNDNKHVLSNILICKLEAIYTRPKQYSPYHLSKSGLLGIIFLTACIVLTFLICVVWFVVLYCRRMKYERKKNKVQQALARTVQEILDKSPIIIFDTKNNDITDDDPMCAICLESFIDNEQLRKLKCSHYFHIACIDPWLLAHQSCPLCNQNILDDYIPTVSANVNIREGIIRTSLIHIDEEYL
ncbi:unnamed protein product [Adineta steineri]|uniref:RING-type domain-containing protein n=1 Tax=Adineta steineri TaxID=433720 RepID=A0A815D7V9_9BILA|nr:unnamed protein product [Adineta steineri]